MHVNPYIFFFLKDGEIIAWDYKNHQQFSLENEYFERLQAWSQGQALAPLPIDEDLAEGKLLSKTPTPAGEWGWDLLSQIYHIGTQNIAEEFVNLNQEEFVQKYLTYCKEISDTHLDLFTEREGKTIPLPDPDFSYFKDINFLEVLKNRKTCRSFKGEPISIGKLSTLLHISFGLLHGEWNDLIENDLLTLGIRKAFPSGGGLHPEEAYLIALNVDGLELGAYHYRCKDHKLTLIKQGSFEEKLIQLLYGQYFAQGIAFGIFLTARFDKTWWKYPHSRGYRVVLLDIGHASQTFLLTATALGLNTWLTGAFSDQNVEEFLEIQVPSESSLFFVAAGYGDNKSIDPEMIKAIQNLHL